WPGSPLGWLATLRNDSLSQFCSTCRGASGGRIFNSAFCSATAGSVGVDSTVGGRDSGTAGTAAASGARAAGAVGAGIGTGAGAGALAGATVSAAGATGAGGANGFLYSVGAVRMDTAVGLYSAAGAAETAWGAGLVARLPRARPEPRLLLNGPGSVGVVGGAVGALAVSVAAMAAPVGSGSDMLCYLL